MGTEWLADAIIYEIYPQSFADSNGDGIGDFRGVIDRLDHLVWLGVDTIWFNPCFDSPFVDAGYDVRDYLRVAPRYGTNDDLIELVAEAKQRGIRVLLDLVAGHTSIEHEWFQADLRRDGTDPDGDRYVWCDRPPEPEATEHLTGMPAWVPSPGPRRATTSRTSTTSNRHSTSAGPTCPTTSPGATPSTHSDRSATVRRCATSCRSGSTAVSPDSGSTWRSRW